MSVCGKLRMGSTSILALSAFLTAACQPQPGAQPGAVGAAPSTATYSSRPNGDLILGERALASGDLAVAKQAFEDAMRRQPDDWRAVVGLAETHLAVGEMETANRLFSLLTADRFGTNARVLQGRGLIAMFQGRAEEASALLERAVQIDGTLWRAWMGLGRSYDRAGETSNARRAFAAAERHAPSRAPVQNDIGMSYMRSGDAATAMGYFRKALQANPGHQIARANMRIAKAMTRDYDGAIAGAPADQVADVLNNVGYVAILNKDYDIADRLLRQAVDISPVHHAAALANLDLLAQAAVGQPIQPTNAVPLAETPNNRVAFLDTANARPNPDPNPRPAPAERPRLIEDIETADIPKQPAGPKPAPIAPAATPAPQAAKPDRPVEFAWQGNSGTSGETAASGLEIAATRRADEQPNQVPDRTGQAAQTNTDAIAQIPPAPTAAAEADIGGKRTAATDTDRRDRRFKWSDAAAQATGTEASSPATDIAEVTPIAVPKRADPPEPPVGAATTPPTAEVPALVAAARAVAAAEDARQAPKAPVGSAPPIPLQSVQPRSDQPAVRTPDAALTEVIETADTVVPGRIIPESGSAIKVQPGSNTLHPDERSFNWNN